MLQSEKRGGKANTRAMRKKNKADAIARVEGQRQVREEEEKTREEEEAEEKRRGEEEAEELRLMHELCKTAEQEKVLQENKEAIERLRAVEQRLGESDIWRKEEEDRRLVLQRRLDEAEEKIRGYTCQETERAAELERMVQEEVRLSTLALEKDMLLQPSQAESTVRYLDPTFNTPS